MDQSTESRKSVAAASFKATLDDMQDDFEPE
jgi:hypothetical protein